MNPCIAYRGGYRYQLAENYSHQTELSEVVDTPLLRLNAGPGPTDGVLWVSKGYAWDGPGGISWDSRTFMRGSLVHDALYQLIREGHLGYDQREYADDLLRLICLEDGMWPFRAWYVHKAVRAFARSASKPSAKRPLMEAP